MIAQAERHIEDSMLETAKIFVEGKIRCYLPPAQRTTIDTGPRQKLIFKKMSGWDIAHGEVYRVDLYRNGHTRMIMEVGGYYCPQRQASEVVDKRRRHVGFADADKLDLIIANAIYPTEELAIEIEGAYIDKAVIKYALSMLRQTA